MPRVLIVDDDADIRDLVIYKLEQAGYEVDSAADGEAGLAAAIASQPDLVLLDVMMPKLSGIEVCRRLRAHPATSATLIVLLTAKAREDDVHDGLAAGAADYIVKPFSPRDLLARIEEVIAKHG
jgi:DNA-binding response OmpR family regulator